MENAAELAQWVCECEQNNPLFVRKCSNCGKNIPQSELDRIYLEEVKRYKGIFKQEAFQKALRRCTKKCQRLRKWKEPNAVLAICLLLSIIIGALIFNGDEIQRIWALKETQYNQRFGQETGELFMSRWHGFRVLPYYIVSYVTKVDEAINTFGELVAIVFTKVCEVLAYIIKFRLLI